MKRVMSFLLPMEKKFFGMLSEQSEIALEASKELMSFAGDYEKIERSERKQRLQYLKSLKEKNKEATNNIILELNKSFRTPIDKEDIGQLAVLIDDITSLTNSVASRFVILGVERVDDYTPKLINSLHKCLGEMNKSIKDLDKLKGVEEHYSKINAFKNEADQVYEDALSELFHFYKNSMDIIKYKEIYEQLGKILDKCIDVSFVISKIFAKHK